ncbi:MAG: aspartate dehydrogenase [Proteobacteria bacterium]|nr:aspartate dehydrogenase [Pseudomonadota bacterium]
MTPSRELGIGIAGLGAIGLPLARRLDDGVPGLALRAVSGRDPAKTAAAIAELKCRPRLVPAVELAQHVDIVVDCAPTAAFREIAEATIAAGRTLVTVNAAALLDHFDLTERVKATGGRIIVPTGALLGLDAVAAAAEGRIERVTMVTRKPPAGLKGAPYLVERGITLDDVREPLKVFDGNARDAARGFPANVNVAAALSMAGIGPLKTQIQIWADPTVTRNTHRIEVEADSARFAMTIEGVPSPENPRTGKLTPLSVLATLRRLVAPFRVGT